MASFELKFFMIFLNLFSIDSPRNTHGMSLLQHFLELLKNTFDAQLKIKTDFSFKTTLLTLE